MTCKSLAKLAYDFRRLRIWCTSHMNCFLCCFYGALFRVCSLNCYCMARTEHRFFNTFDCVSHWKYTVQVWNDKKMSKRWQNLTIPWTLHKPAVALHFEAFFCFPQPSEVWFEFVFAAFVRSAAQAIWIHFCQVSLD